MAAATTPQPTTDRAEGDARRRPSSRPDRTPWWMWLAVAAIVVFCLFPFYWLINISLKTGADLRRSSADPAAPDAGQLPGRSSRTRTSRRRCATARSSALGTTVLALTVGSFCAYALARLKLRGKCLILAIVLTISTFPQIAIAAPLFKLWSDIGLFNTLDRPDHPVPDVRAAAGDLHPRVVLQGDPEGPRGGGAGRRRDALPGVPQGGGAAGRAGPGHRRPS